MHPVRNQSGKRAARHLEVDQTVTVGELKAAVARLAGLLVLCEPSDGPSVEALVRALEETARLAKLAGDKRTEQRATDAAALAGRVLSNRLPDQERALALLSEAVAEVTGGPRSALDMPATIEDAQLMGEFIDKTGEYLDAADEDLLVLERDPGNKDALDAVFRAFHTIKGMAGCLSLDSIQELAHEGESLLEAGRGSREPLGQHTLDDAFAAVDRLRMSVRDVVADTATDQGGWVEPEVDARDTDATTRARAARETVRVDAERLDQLLDAIGELVIAESMASRTARIEAGRSVALRQQLGRLDKLTRQLHEMTGSLKMVPLRPTFQRLARAVRDVSRKSGKRVRLVMSGYETELDKAVVDYIEDPLMHLVRNAVDHGIESDVAAREAAGKPQVGRIELRAYHKGGAIYVEVEDDGAGLDRDSIVAKARAMGLIGETEPSLKELFSFLFLPGFSTSEVVTDVSGRGVGMDVVKRAVDSLSGQVSVRSEPGVGTTFILRLPVTLAVIDGMAVRVGTERYIVPTLSVVRSVRPVGGDLCTVLGTGEVMQHGDELVRLIRLAELFEQSASSEQLTESIVMIVEDDGERAGLVVDELLGQQQIVIKSLGQALGEVVGVSGGAVMPDGRVGLILDVEGLVSLADAN